MKTGISSIITQRHFSLEEGVRNIAQAGFDCVDFSLCSHFLPSVEKSESFLSDDWRDLSKRVRKMLDQNNLEAYQAHASWGVTTDLSDFYPPDNMYIRQIEVALVLGVKQLVFHPVLPKTKVIDFDMNRRYIEYNARWFRALVPFAEENEVCICIENVFSQPDNIPEDGLFPFTVADSMLELADLIGSKYVTFCLDIGHAYIEMGEKIYGMVRKLGNRLKAVHISDNIGRLHPIYSSDLHLLPVYNRLNINAICQELNDIGFDGALSLEIIDRSNTKEQWWIQMEYASKLARYYTGIADNSIKV